MLTDVEMNEALREKAREVGKKIGESVADAIDKVYSGLIEKAVLS